MRSSDFRKLTVWQKAMDLAEKIYIVTLSFPKNEEFGLVSQIRRAAVSVSSNIAEGAGRNSPKDFDKFLSIARGSLWEISSQIELCIRLKYLNREQTYEIMSLIEEVNKMIFSLSNSLNV